MTDPMALETNVLYVAAEKGYGEDSLKHSKTTEMVQLKSGKNPGDGDHPLCDIFFRTKRNQLVLIEVDGGGGSMIKAKRLQKWINAHPVSCLGTKAFGVVLAPSSTEASKVLDMTVAVVTGEDALKFLGALGQLRTWFDAGLNLIPK